MNRIDELDLEYNSRSGTYKIINEMWFCGPPEKGPNGEKFDGAYPSGFLKNVKNCFEKYYPILSENILHVCAGRVPREEGVTQDIDAKYSPTILCNAEEITTHEPSLVDSFLWVMADPPYNIAAAEKYYKKDLLNKSKMIREMALCCRKGGFVSILDEAIVTNAPKSLKRVAIIGITVNPNKQIRSYSVFRKIK